MYKKVLLFLGLFLVSFFLLPSPVHAFSGGDGTSGTPYQISSCVELADVDTFPSSYFVLTSDLDCTASANAVMIGDSVAFTGNFNGNGHTITVDIDKDTPYAGLFAVVTGGTITNTRVSGSITSTAGHVGGVVGNLGSASTAERVVNTATVTGAGHVGGIAGYISNSTLRNSYNVGVVTSTGGQYFAGGITGMVEGSSLLEYVYNRGVVTGSYHIGGITGWRSGTTTLIRYTFNVGQVLSSQSTFFFGGIWGNDASSDGSTLVAGYTSNYFDASRSTRTMCGYSNSGGRIDPVAGQCEAVNTNWSSASYFKGNNTNAPLNSWDFDTIWDPVTGGYPALQAIANDDTVVNDDPSVPAAPQSFIVSNATATSLQMTWTAPNNGGLSLTQYTLSYRIQGSETWSTQVLGSWQTNATLSGLQSSTTYELSLVATNSLGDGTAATTTGATTEGLGAPTDFTVTENELNSLAIDVAWQASSGSPIGYYVFYRPASSTWDDGYNDFYVDNATTYTGFMGDLLPETTYVFRVAAVDSNWEFGAYSSEVTYTVPAAPILLVGTCLELQDAATTVQNSDEMYLSTIKFTNDIDCSATAEWNDGAGFVPFDSFGGTIDGQGHSLLNLTINQPDNSYVGLISSLDGNGRIRNLEIIGADITGGNYTAILVGDTYDEIVGTFENITVSESMVTSNGGRVGGLIGRIDEDASFSFSNINVSASVVGEYEVGGIVGKLDDSNEVSFNNAAFSGEVVALSSDDSAVGGIAGFVESYVVEMDEISVSGAIEGYYSVGGVVGELSYSDEFSLSEVNVSADVSGYEGVGGVIGYGDSYAEIAYASVSGDIAAENMRAGGIIGYAYDGFIYKSENSGTVTGVYRVGGLVGSASDIEIEQSKNAGTITAIFEGDSYNGDFKGVGGLVGIVWGLDVSQSQNLGTVNGTGALYVGGVAGACSTCYVSESFNAGTINGDITWHDYNGVGGLIGSFVQGHITNSMNHGTVNGKISVGGITGFGAVAEVINSYNSGQVSSISAMGEGGIIGANLPISELGSEFESLEISNTFNVGEVSSSATEFRSGGGILGGTTNNSELVLTNNWWSNSLANGIGNTALTSSSYTEGTLDLPETEVENEVVGQYQKTESKTVFQNTTEVPPLSLWNFDEVWQTKTTGYPELKALIVAATPTPTATPRPTTKVTSVPTLAPTTTPTTLPTGEVKILLNDFIEYLNGVGKEILSLSIGQVVYFTHDDEEHSATVQEIGEDYVIVIVASTPQEVKLMVGHSKEVDVNDDNVNDVRVTLKGINGDKADLLFVQLTAPTDSVTATPPVTKVVDVKQENPDSKNSWLLGLLVVVLPLFFILLFKKRKKNEK